MKIALLLILKVVKILINKIINQVSLKVTLKLKGVALCFYADVALCVA